jgi:conjugative transfer signal peptidase TraF
MTRSGWVIATALTALGVGASAGVHPAPRLLWNASASAPIGLYAVRPAGALQVGDLVAARPPEPLASFLAVRRYLPLGVPLLKHVAALPGQTICRTGVAVTVDGAPAAVALDRDRWGRALPAWRGCRRLGPGEVLVLNRRPDSLDGRYFEALPTAAVIGRAAPIWIPGTR